MAASEPPYRFETASGYTVVVIQPQLNDSQWSDFETVGNELLNRIGDVKPPAVLIDLSGLSYMGSAMVALIVRLWKAIRERGGKMVVINRHEMVFEVMKLAGLNNVWTIVPDRDQALKALGKKGGGGGGGQGSSGMLLALGAVGVVVAAVGLAMMFDLIPWSGAAKIKTAITIAGAALGLIGGAMTAARASDGAQKAGVLILIASVAMLILGIVLMSPDRAEAVSNADGGGSKQSGAADSSATADGESRRKKKKEDRHEDALPATPPAEVAKPAEEVKVGETVPPANAAAPAINIAGDEASKNAADAKEGNEKPVKKTTGGFGAVRAKLEAAKEKDNADDKK